VPRSAKTELAAVAGKGGVNNENSRFLTAIRDDRRELRGTCQRRNSAFSEELVGGDLVNGAVQQMMLASLQTGGAIEIPAIVAKHAGVGIQSVSMTFGEDVQ
jgi:hypothetical protein